MTAKSRDKKIQDIGANFSGHLYPKCCISTYPSQLPKQWPQVGPQAEEELSPYQKHLHHHFTAEQSYIRVKGMQTVQEESIYFSWIKFLAESH